MITHPRWSALTVAVLAFATIASAEDAKEVPSPWGDDLAAAEATARESGKPIFLVFR